MKSFNPPLSMIRLVYAQIQKLNANQNANGMLKLSAVKIFNLIGLDIVHLCIFLNIKLYRICKRRKFGIYPGEFYVCKTPLQRKILYFLLYILKYRPCFLKRERELLLRAVRSVRYLNGADLCELQMLFSSVCEYMVMSKCLLYLGNLILL